MESSHLKAKRVLQASPTGGSEIEVLAQHLQELADEGDRADQVCLLAAAYKEN